jgi:hypothetical protein
MSRHSLLLYANNIQGFNVDKFIFSKSIILPFDGDEGVNPA